MYKISYYGINCNAFHWVKDFLTDRTQTVTLEGETSNKIPVTSGVPQGTVLAPILRCIFITTPFRLNLRSCLLSDSGNATFPTFVWFSQQTVSTFCQFIVIFSDWKHRWRNTIYIQEIEIRSYVISLGDNDFILSAQQIFVTHLLNTKKENFKNVMFLE